MAQPEIKAIPDGIHTITPHLVVRDAARAAEWYKAAFGAEERGRIPVPGGKYMQIELCPRDPTRWAASSHSSVHLL